MEGLQKELRLQSMILRLYLGEEETIKKKKKPHLFPLKSVLSQECTMALIFVNIVLGVMADAKKRKQVRRKGILTERY